MCGGRFDPANGDNPWQEKQSQKRFEENAQLNSSLY